MQGNHPRPRRKPWSEFIHIVGSISFFLLDLLRVIHKRRDSALCGMAVACGADGRCATAIARSQQLIQDMEVVNIRDQRLELLEN